MYTILIKFSFSCDFWRNFYFLFAIVMQNKPFLQISYKIRNWFMIFWRNRPFFAIIEKKICFLANLLKIMIFFIPGKKSHNFRNLWWNWQSFLNDWNNWCFWRLFVWICDIFYVRIYSFMPFCCSFLAILVLIL